MIPTLATNYLGLSLSGPVIASASPVDRTARRPQGAAGRWCGGRGPAVAVRGGGGRGGDAPRRHDGRRRRSFAEFTGSPLPEIDLPELGAARHLRLIERAKGALSIPVIGSLNAVHPGSWERYATEMVDAGADAIELNLYSVAADPAESADDVEARHLGAIAASSVRDLGPAGGQAVAVLLRVVELRRRGGHRGGRRAGAVQPVLRPRHRPASRWR